MKKLVAILFLLATAAGLQYTFDLNQREAPRSNPVTLSPATVRAVDLGLHSMVASFLWLSTITQLPHLPYGPEKFRNDLELINDLDPKFSFPYAFTVMVLPYTHKYPDRVNAALEIGKRGVEYADPDWRIPFYVAAIYHLEFKDKQNAAHYFDIAAQIPEAPFPIRRFSINYGISPNMREQTKQIWAAIYETTQDADTKERARAYVTRFEIFNLLDDAAKQYKKQFGRYPANLDELVGSHIVNELPIDPFGFEFVIDKDGVVGIRKD